MKRIQVSVLSLSLCLPLAACGRVENDGALDSGAKLDSGADVAAADSWVMDTPDAISVPDSRPREDGCPAYMPCGGACSFAEMGRDCWYKYQCEYEFGVVQECVCERIAGPDAPYQWQVKKSCRCPVDASAGAACP